MSSKRYITATAFRTALENRLKNHALQHGVDLQEIRRQVAFERFLCRFFIPEDSPWVLLKGGYAMELRNNFARSTRDIDLTLNRAALEEKLQQYESQFVIELLKQHAERDLEDYFVFLVGSPMHSLDNAPYGGERYPIEAKVDGRTFVKFHIDISSGDSDYGSYDFLKGKDWLNFASIQTGNFAAISVEQQFAEKLHADTMPREDRINSKFRDLIDMVLLIEGKTINMGNLKKFILGVFNLRKSHDLPKFLEEPPANWKEPLEAMAPDCSLKPNMQKQFIKVRDFVNSMLEGMQNN